MAAGTQAPAQPEGRVRLLRRDIRAGHGMLRGTWGYIPYGDIYPPECPACGTSGTRDISLMSPKMSRYGDIGFGSLSATPGWTIHTRWLTIPTKWLFIRDNEARWNAFFFASISAPGMARS